MYLQKKKLNNYRILSKPIKVEYLSSYLLYEPNYAPKL